MKSRVTTLIISVALTLLVAGASIAQTAGTPPAPGACALQFETIHHDLGEIPDTSPVRFTFKFKNVSDRRVTLASVRGHGGSTPPAFNKRAYEPGESGEVLVTINPKNRKGRQTKSVVAETDDPICPRVEATLSMTVVPRVYIEPSKIFFTEVMRGQGSTQTVTVTGRAPNFEIIGIEGENPVFAAAKTASEPFVENGRTLTRVTLELTLSKSAPLGTHNCTFTLSTNDPQAARVSMPVAGAVVGDVCAMPPGMLVRTFTPRTPFQAQVRVDSRSNRAFTIKSVDVAGPADMDLAVDVQPSVEDGKAVFLVMLAGRTPAAAGQYRGVITVATDIPGEEPFKFNWIATVKDGSTGAR